jgi:hypothetical protein
VRYPRVTEVLEAAGIGPDYSEIPETIRADRLARAAGVGTATHAAIDLLEQGDLDRSSLHPLIAPRVAAYERFVADTGFRRIRGEFEVRSERWRYLGHPDSTGWLGTERIGIDAKATAVFDHDATSIQAKGGYGIAYNEMFPDEPISRWFGLWLRGDGTYRFVPLIKPDSEQLFLAALICWHERARRRNDGGSRLADAA